MSDAPLLFRKTLAGLEPANRAAREAMDGVEIGHHVRVKITQPRNNAHNAKYWLLCQKIAEAIGPTITSDLVSNTLKLRTGHVDVVHTAHGEVRFPKSIAFAKMDQTEFSAFYERCLVIICSDFLPGVKPGDLRTQIEGLVAA